MNKDDTDLQKWEMSDKFTGQLTWWSWYIEMKNEMTSSYVYRNSGQKHRNKKYLCHQLEGKKTLVTDRMWVDKLE